MDIQETPKSENTTPEIASKPETVTKPVAVRKPAATNTNPIAKPTTTAAPRRRTPAAKPADAKVEVEKVDEIP